MQLPLDHSFFESKTPSNKLMIILHGRGDSAEGFRFFPQELGLDDMNYLLLNAPFEYFTGFSWYDLPPNQEPGIEYSKKVLTEILDTVFKDKYEPSKTILFGFSQGSLLTFEFGARYKEKLAGYIAVSGYVYNAPKILEEMNQDLKNANWLCTHGYEDDVLPYHESRAQIEVLLDGDFEIDFRAYHKTHTVDPGEFKEIKKWIVNKLK
ncbi:alpha/beta fold hydrolase [Sulfurimonas sp. MAG313]|nr:alpha/beta fold hydrolase [Sulfurimonas sp. MAG313]MDF1880659.1 alpha/beta fold hydrolase [Sulfurimonas sp. MAG313]MDF1882300.1 alpha/beta fold hydrolase [Sulfurimonas sp. MAG313]